MIVLYCLWPTGLLVAPRVPHSSPPVLAERASILLVQRYDGHGAVATTTEAQSHFPPPLSCPEDTESLANRVSE